MKNFLRRVSPRRAVADFAGHWRQPTAHRWPILGVAMASTFAFFMLMIPPSQMVKPAPPEVIYISTFEQSRSQAQIIASNCANQALKNQMRALLEEREEKRRDMYRALGRATFVDVEAMEAEIAREKAAQVAEAAQSRQAAGKGGAGGESESGGAPGAELALSVEEYCARGFA